MKYDVYLGKMNKKLRKFFFALQEYFEPPPTIVTTVLELGWILEMSVGASQVGTTDYP